MSTEQEQKELDDPLGTKIDAEREMGMAGGSNNQDLLMSQREALMMLRDSINQTPEISPNQVLAAGALALAPAIGGYIAGKSVGNAYISPWLKPETILDMEMPGASSAAADALGTGVKEGDKYLAQLRAQSKAENEQKYKVGSLVYQQENANQRSRENLEAQKERDTTEFGREKELIRLRAAYNNNGRTQIPLNDTLAMAAQAKILRGEQPSPEESAAYSKYVTDPRDAALISNAISRGANVDLRGQGFERSGLQLGLAGFEAEPNPQMLPRPEVVKELQLKAGGLASMQSLLQTYIDNPGDPIIGQASAQNAALSGMLMNAGRMYTHSGANFTETEQRMLRQALPAIMAGDLTGAIKSMALGRDQKTFARDIQGIMQKAFNFEVYGATRYRKQGLPPGYYGESDWLTATPTSSVTSNPSVTPTPKFNDNDLSDAANYLQRRGK